MPLKGVLRKKNMNPNLYIYCCIIDYAKLNGKILYTVYLHILSFGLENIYSKDTHLNECSE